MSSSKAWMARHLKDIYVKKAFEQDLRSRASFKLQEINTKYKLIKPSSKILDLGAAPGGWSLYASNLINIDHGGKIIAIDLLSFEDIPNVVRLQGDFTSSVMQNTIVKLLNNDKFNFVMSDMLMNTTGDAQTDHLRSMNLSTMALEFAIDYLEPNGHFLCKFFQGSDDKEFINLSKKYFNNVKVVKPKSSRSESRERFLVAMNRNKDEFF